MAKQIEQEIEYYYDSHPTKEDLMGERASHRSLTNYLAMVLKWSFHGQVCAIYENLNLYSTTDPDEYPIAPDIMVIKGVEFEDIPSWSIARMGRSPQVVFEILSKKTWKTDIEEKPELYAGMGIQEYFAYDPNMPPLSQKTKRRLFGWRLNQMQGGMVRILPDASGRMWSEQLNSWLVPDGRNLRLYDRNDQLRLTETEVAVKRAEEEARRADIEAKARQALAEKLRSLGINPDEVT